MKLTLIISTYIKLTLILITTYARLRHVPATKWLKIIFAKESVPVGKELLSKLIILTQKTVAIAAILVIYLHPKPVPRKVIWQSLISSLNFEAVNEILPASECCSHRLYILCAPFSDSLPKVNYTFPKTPALPD